MKKKINLNARLLVPVLTIVGISFNAVASGTTDALSTVSMKVAESSKIAIQGTSTVHDWESVTGEINGSGIFTLDQGKITGVNNVQITVPAKSITSGKSGMDKKTYEALKADKAPNIRFELTQIKSVGDNSITATGNLTIAGVTKPVTLTADYTLQNNQVVLNGSHKMNMTTFNIEPPTAMLGAIKTGEEITINFELVFLNE